MHVFWPNVRDAGLTNTVPDRGRPVSLVIGSHAGQTLIDNSRSIHKRGCIRVVSAYSARRWQGQNSGIPLATASQLTVAWLESKNLYVQTEKVIPRLMLSNPNERSNPYNKVTWTKSSEMHQMWSEQPLLIAIDTKMQVRQSINAQHFNLIKHDSVPVQIVCAC